MKNNKLLILFSFIFIIGLIGSIQAEWQIEKHLVQLQVDENYPCHIENENEIVCNPISEEAITSWKDKIDNIPVKIDDGTGKEINNPEKDKGSLKDSEKKDYLTNRITLYQKGSEKKSISLKSEYREKINIYSLNDDLISIGFATNLFGVSGTPFENFDTNSTTGLVRYRHLNMTWVDLSGLSNSYSKFNLSIGGITYNNTYYIGKNNFSISLWFKALSKQGTFYNVYGIAGRSSTNCYSGSDNSIFGIGLSNKSNLTYFFGCSSDLPTFIFRSNNTINDSLWHNVILIKGEKNNSYFYLDNILINYTENNENLGNINLSINNLDYVVGSLGSDANLGAYTFNGSVDEFRLFNYSLNSDEITQIYNSGRYKNDSLVSQIYAPFNENSGKPNNDFDSAESITFNLKWNSDNINVTTAGYEVNITIANISNALTFWDNYTLINQSLSGTKIFSFLNNQSIYILNDFVLTEGVSTTNSPLNITSTTTTTDKTYSISSLINEDIIVPISVNVPSGYKLKSVTLTPKDKTSYSPVYTYDSTTRVLSIPLANLSKSSSSNVLTLGLLTEQQQNVCTGFFGASSSFFDFFGIIIIIVAAGVIFFMLMSEGSTDLDLTTMAIVLVVSGVALTFGMVIVNSISGC